MRKSLFNCAAALSFVATAGVAAAQTQTQPCLSEEEMRGVAGFLLPSLHVAVTEACSAHLASDGYLATSHDRLAAKFAAGAQADWPIARAAILKLGSARSPQGMPELPDEFLQPMVEAGVSGEIASRIDANQCRQIERVAESIDPLPRANVVTLLATMMPMVGSPNRRLRTCPAS